MREVREFHLVQYRIMADHRLHFGRLFFQVIAFNLILALATLSVLSSSPLGWAPAAGAAGLILLGTAGVSSRLLGQEQRYASAMTAREESAEGFIAVTSGSPWGSRRLTILALGTLGVLVIGGSLWAEFVYPLFSSH